MRAQLERLVAAAEHPKVTIQVIPGAIAHAGLLGHFVIADPDGKPSVAYLETAAEGQVTDSPSVIFDVALSFDTPRAEALPWAASRDLIRKLAEQPRPVRNKKGFKAKNGTRGRCWPMSSSTE